MDEQTEARLQKIQLLGMDVDGVLTDGMAFYGSEGLEAMRFNVQDGSGIKYLQRNGIEVALITGRKVEAVLDRASDLGIDYVYRGEKVKLDAYRKLQEESGLADGQIAYVGDDLPDVPVLRRVGVSFAVANARPEVKAVCDVITAAEGGHGAIREVAEMLLKARGDWENVLKRYFED